MRKEELTTINGEWSERDNAWVSETIGLTGDCWIEAELAGKGRMVIKKSEHEEGPWPKALISSWTGPKFRVRCYGTTEGRFIRIYLTSTPTTIQK
ncbi:MAG: hypothetical protein IJT48_12090, partial [Bacteroidaceae bacterium]|nr:hypothetical protein [Bacteroidaceae bacterium]